MRPSGLLWLHARPTNKVISNDLARLTRRFPPTRPRKARGNRPAQAFLPEYARFPPISDHNCPRSQPPSRVQILTRAYCFCLSPSALCFITAGKSPGRWGEEDPPNPPKAKKGREPMLYKEITDPIPKYRLPSRPEWPKRRPHFIKRNKEPTADTELPTAVEAGVAKAPATFY